MLSPALNESQQRGFWQLPSTAAHVTVQAVIEEGQRRCDTAESCCLEAGWYCAREVALINTCTLSTEWQGSLSVNLELKKKLVEVHDQLGRDKEQHEGGDNHNYNPKDNLNYFNGVIPCWRTTLAEYAADKIAAFKRGARNTVNIFSTISAALEIPQIFAQIFVTK